MRKRRKRRLPIPRVFTEKNSTIKLETSVSSIRIEIESAEVQRETTRQVPDKIVDISGTIGSSKSEVGTREYFQTATSSVIDAIRFAPYESQSVVTGDQNVMMN